ncbi:MAG: hypothetical protein FJ276_37760, partial [Planctomycetes bacterium]|nr:hypothetical protein [Planctomycetota bacterium]
MRIRESIKWQKALSTLQPDYRLNAKTALAALPQAEFDKHSQLENKVVIAFAEELTKEEHTRLAKGEAARPQSFYDARVREAFEWLLNHQELRPEDRLRRWES